MSNIDKRALRLAAEKATPGVWVYLPKNTSIEYDYGSDDSQGSVTYMDSGDFTQKQTDLNGDFIAAANPATVLALLDELEAKDRRIAELEAREVALPERYEVDVCPTSSPSGDWYSREDVLAALVSAGVRFSVGTGKGD